MRTLTDRDERLVRTRAQVVPFVLSYARFVRECQVHVASLSVEELRALIEDAHLMLASDDWSELITADMLGFVGRSRLRALEALPSPSDVPAEGAVPTAVQGAWNDAGETP